MAQNEAQKVLVGMVLDPDGNMQVQAALPLEQAVLLSMQLTEQLRVAYLREQLEGGERRIVVATPGMISKGGH